MPKPTLDLNFIRSLYPEPCWKRAFFENAGGSYVPDSVIEWVNAYMRETQVQPGANYEASATAAERINDGQRLMSEMIGANPDEIIIGSSTSMNVYVLANALGGLFEPGDEIIVTNLDHEANIGAWARLAERGMVIREWSVNPDTERLEPETLDALLSDKTRLVCFSHCSNILGGTNDVAGITSQVHAAGAMVCVDGVAHVPHRAVDVKALGVDFYLLSPYKMYGPHLGLMYAKREHIERAPGQNHYFLDNRIPLKLNPGGPNHEFTAALRGIADYFETLAAHHLNHPPNTFKARVDAMFGLMEAQEETLAERFVDYVTSKPNVRLFGPKTGEAALRVPVFSFTVKDRSSAEISAQLATSGVAIGQGDFYAPRLLQAFGIPDTNDGVLRASMVHYNTLDEVDRLIEALDGVI